MARLKTSTTLPLLFIVGVFLIQFSAVLAEKKDSAPADAPELKWLRLDEGIKDLEADTTGKHVFIHITAAWCGWCKKMEKEAFADPKVINYINEYFVPVRIWGDSDKIVEIEGYKISERNLARDRATL